MVEMELTKRGAALAADAPEAAQGRLLHALEAMPPRQVRSIRRAVDRLLTVAACGLLGAVAFGLLGALWG